jgi:ABC-type antimicrobial peptide transport system permease subunit
MAIVVRVSGDSPRLATDIRDQLAKLDPEAALGRIRMMDDLLSESAGRPRFRTILLSAFAGVGLLLAAIGIYGVTSYTVSQRTREMGLRLALGAPPGDLARLVVREGLALAITGAAVGLLGAFALTRLMASLLFGVAPIDLPTFAAASLLLTCVALISCLVPARRAMSADPLVSLRCD